MSRFAICPSARLATVVFVVSSLSLTGCQSVSAEQRSNGLRTMAPVENIDQRKAPAAASATPKANPAAAVAATPAVANPAWDMFQQLEGLRTTVASLQGRVEEQQQVIDRLKEDSRARYTDLDQRIGLLEQSMGPAPINPGAAAATPAAAATLADIETQKQAYLAAYQSFRSDGPAAETPANLDAASAQFNRVIKEYEGSPKVASSYYKLGTIADLRNQRNEARQLMQTVVNRFSDSAEAGLAKSYLDQNPAEVTR